MILGVLPASADSHDWIDLWDGKSFDGWKLSTENPSTFRIEDGVIVAQGPRAHLFYVGEALGGEVRNFELKVDVLAKNNSNGGIYFHTAYQEEGWPLKGFEVQVNNTFARDPRKSGSLYAVMDNVRAPAKDDEWFTEHIVVRDKNVKIYVNGKLITNWVQPDDWAGVNNFPDRVLDKGIFALQGHDPGSTVMYKNIRARVLD